MILSNFYNSLKASRLKTMSSFIGKMFGKKDQTPTAPEAIEKLRDTEDMLAKKQVLMFFYGEHPLIGTI